MIKWSQQIIKVNISSLQFIMQFKLFSLKSVSKKMTETRTVQYWIHFSNYGSWCACGAFRDGNRLITFTHNLLKRSNNFNVSMHNHLHVSGRFSSALPIFQCEWTVSHKVLWLWLLIYFQQAFITLYFPTLEQSVCLKCIFFNCTVLFVGICKIWL